MGGNYSRKYGTWIFEYLSKVYAMYFLFLVLTTVIIYSIFKPLRIHGNIGVHLHTWTPAEGYFSFLHLAERNLGPRGKIGRLTVVGGVDQHVGGHTPP